MILSLPCLLENTVDIKNVRASIGQYELGYKGNEGSSEIICTICQRMGIQLCLEGLRQNIDLLDSLKNFASL